MELPEETQDRGGRSSGPERGPGIHTCSRVVGGDPAGFRGASPGLSFFHVAPPSLLPKSIFYLWSAFGFLQATACPLPLAVPHITPRKDTGWAAPLPPKSTQLGATWVAPGSAVCEPRE